MSAWTTQGPNLDTSEVVSRRMSGERMPLFIFGHQGMGDHILCNGLYRWLSDFWQINVLVISTRKQNVQFMLSDISDARVIPFPTEAALCHWLTLLHDAVVLRMGFSSGEAFDRWSFDREFYSQAHVDFSIRWDRYQIPPGPQVPIPREKYVFVHDNPDMGSTIKISGIRPKADRTIFEHRRMIQGASELRCSSSAFAVFADSYDLSGKRLFFYPFGREIPTLKNPWKILK